MGRLDKNTPVEETIGHLAKYVEAGKIGGMSLPEVSAETIRRASKVHKISGVEAEFSLFTTDILTNGVAEACAELDIPIFAYSPLGRGMLAGRFKTAEDIPEGETRRQFPRLQPDNWDTNMKLVEEIKTIAQGTSCTSGQIALAWVRYWSGRKGFPTIIPIPGATTEERVAENCADIRVSDEDKDIEEILKRREVKGNRYSLQFQSMTWM